MVWENQGINDKPNYDPIPIPISNILLVNMNINNLIYNL